MSFCSLLDHSQCCRTARSLTFSSRSRCSSFSWSGLASTSNLADQQLDGILRSTALYQTHSILPGSFFLPVSPRSSTRLESTHKLIVVLYLLQTSNLQHLLSLLNKLFSPLPHLQQNWPPDSRRRARTRSKPSGRTFERRTTSSRGSSKEMVG